MAFLAIIGLIAILWFLSRGLKRLGNFLNRVGDNMISYSVTVRRTKRDNGSKKNVLDLKDKLEAVKETEEDRNFKSNIRSEIEELTGTEDS